MAATATVSGELSTSVQGVDAAATAFPLHLNVSLPKTGTHTVKAGWFNGLTQMVFTSERWLASVHGVPPS